MASPPCRRANPGTVERHSIRGGTDRPDVTCHTRRLRPGARGRCGRIRPIVTNRSPPALSSRGSRCSLRRRGEARAVRRVSAPERDTGLAADRHRPGGAPAARLWRLAGVLVGAFVANAWISGAVVPSLGIALGNTLEAVVGAWLVNRYASGRHAFERPRDIFRFAGLAMVATMISASFGPVSLGLGGLARWSDFAPIWLTWWLGDASGALLVTPVLPDLGAEPATPHDSRERLEAALLLLRRGGRRPGRLRRPDSLADHGAPARVSVSSAARHDRVPARHPRGRAREPAAGRRCDRLHPTRDRPLPPGRLQRVAPASPGLLGRRGVDDGGAGGRGLPSAGA